jgi:hypothetical protein
MPRNGYLGFMTESQFDPQEYQDQDSEATKNAPDEARPDLDVSGSGDGGEATTGDSADAGGETGTADDDLLGGLTGDQRPGE